MSSPEKPDDFPLQAGASIPDLTMSPWKEGSMSVDDQNAGEQDKAAQQSIFSVRSGIQDPLIKSDSKPEPEVPELSITDTERVGEEPTEEESAPSSPDRKRRKQKSKAKLVKSKRQLDRARRRQMNYLQRRREQKKMRVFYNRIRVVFKLCFALLWAVLLWELVHSARWNFTPAQYTVENQHLLQAGQLAPMVNRWKGKPLYTIDTGKIAKDIQNHYDILQSVHVRRQLFPARLEVQVQEKKPWAELYADDKHPQPYGLAVPDGLISLETYQYQPATYQRVPLEHLLVQPNMVFKMSYLAQLRDVAWQAHHIKGLHLVSVDIRNPNQVVLNFQEVPVILGKLNNSTSERLARLIPLMPKINEFRDGIEAVDLRWDEQVTFHQKPNNKIDLPQPEKTQG
jgi:cell division septal protein FtsQ